MYNFGGSRYKKEQIIKLLFLNLFTIKRTLQINTYSQNFNINI